MVSTWLNHICKISNITMLIKTTITKMLKGNKKVPAGLYFLNIPFIIIKRKKHIPQIHLS